MGRIMPLERWHTLGYDSARMSFEFTMTDPNTLRTVECIISSTALDQLAGTRGTMPREREAQFLRFRDVIEHIASNLFDLAALPDRLGPIRIFYHHVVLRGSVGNEKLRGR
jgi:Protein of unknown function (DUF1488)